MTRVEALKLLENFIHKELRARKSSSCFYIINGDRICNRCKASKRRTLYMILSEDMPVMLKCFRATCTADFVLDNPGIDVNRARPITEEELIKFGFNNAEAIEAILDVSNLVYKKTRSSFDSNVLVSNNLLSVQQKQYLMDRCRFVPTEEEMRLFHIVPSVNEVIEANDIEVPEALVPIYNSFNPNNSLTFLCGNLTLSTRAISYGPALQKSILNISENVRSIGYYIGDKITDKKTLVVSEGIYDIINAYRVFAQGLEDALYVATLGFSKTLHIIEHYYYQNLEQMETLIIFMDSDIKKTINGVDVYTYDEKQLYNLIRSIDLQLGVSAFKEIFVCYNTKSKDNGDFRKPINMKKLERKDFFKSFYNKKDYIKR